MLPTFAAIVLLVKKDEVFFVFSAIKEILMNSMLKLLRRVYAYSIATSQPSEAAGLLRFQVYNLAACVNDIPDM